MHFQSLAFNGLSWALALAIATGVPAWANDGGTGDAEIDGIIKNMSTISNVMSKLGGGLLGTGGGAGAGSSLPGMTGSGASASGFNFADMLKQQTAGGAGMLGTGGTAMPGMSGGLPPGFSGNIQGTDNMMSPATQSDDQSSGGWPAPAIMPDGGSAMPPGPPGEAMGSAMPPGPPGEAMGSAMPPGPPGEAMGSAMPPGPPGEAMDSAMPPGPPGEAMDSAMPPGPPGEAMGSAMPPGPPGQEMDDGVRQGGQGKVAGVGAPSRLEYLMQEGSAARKPTALRNSAATTAAKLHDTGKYHKLAPRMDNNSSPAGAESSVDAASIRTLPLARSPKIDANSPDLIWDGAKRIK